MGLGGSGRGLKHLGAMDDLNITKQYFKIDHNNYRGKLLAVERLAANDNLFMRSFCTNGFSIQR